MNGQKDTLKHKQALPFNDYIQSEGHLDKFWVVPSSSDAYQSSVQSQLDKKQKGLTKHHFLQTSATSKRTPPHSSQKQGKIMNPIRHKKSDSMNVNLLEIPHQDWF